MTDDSMPQHQQVSHSRVWARRLSRWSLPLILVALCLVITVFSPYFLTSDNIINLARQTAITGIVAIGMTFLIISGGIDLSVGAVMGLAGMVLSLQLKAGMPIWLSVVLTLALSSVIGMINGIVVHKGGVTPFIATLGMMSIARGAAMLLGSGRMITGLPRSFCNFVQLNFLGIPSLVWILALVAVVGGLILSRTRFGRNLYAIGSSVEAARLSGIKIGLNVCAVYSITALTAGLGGILLTARLASGLPSAGSGYELESIAASIIGGTSFTGAEGSIGGTILGAFIMTTLRNGGNLLGIDPFWLQILIGIVTVAAVFLDQVQKKRH